MTNGDNPTNPPNPDNPANPDNPDNLYTQYTCSWSPLANPLKEPIISLSLSIGNSNDEGSENDDDECVGSENNFLFKCLELTFKKRARNSYKI